MMTPTLEFALLANATSLPWAEVPAWSATEFVRVTATELNRGARLCAWFGVPEGSGTCLVAVLAFDADNTSAGTFVRARSLGATRTHPRRSSMAQTRPAQQRQRARQWRIFPRGGRRGSRSRSRPRACRHH